MARPRIALCSDVFAAKGYAWNHPNYQHDACKTGFRRVQEPDGTMRLIDVMDIHGSQQPVSLSPRRAQPRPTVYEPVPVRDDSVRLKYNLARRVAKKLLQGKIYATGI